MYRKISKILCRAELARPTSNHFVLGFAMRYRRNRVEGGSYFFTVVTHQRHETFISSDTVELFNESVRQVQASRPFTIHAQVILRDHLHTIWTLPDHDAEYSQRWSLIKEKFTRAYIKKHGAPARPHGLRTEKREQPIWQRRFWEHTIRGQDDFIKHADYIHLNPVHHGYVSAPRDWPHSTFTEWVERGIYPSDWGSNQLPELPDWARHHE